MKMYKNKYLKYKQKYDTLVKSIDPSELEQIKMRLNKLSSDFNNLISESETNQESNRMTSRSN